MRKVGPGLSVSEKGNLLQSGTFRRRIASQRHYLYDMEERYCAECGERLVGRSDKRFCSTACRTSFHNAQARKRYGCSGRVNSLLRRNHAILWDAISKGRSIICRQELEERMFSFDNYTSLQRKPFRRKVYKCFDISYVRTRSGDIVIKDGL